MIKRFRLAEWARRWSIKRFRLAEWARRLKNEDSALGTETKDFEGATMQTVQPGMKNLFFSERGVSLYS